MFVCKEFSDDGEMSSQIFFFSISSHGFLHDPVAESQDFVLQSGMLLQLCNAEDRSYTTPFSL